MQTLTSIISGIIVGVISTIPLGPISIFVAQRTLLHETRKALYVAIGSVVIDVFYCLVITLGFISLLSPYFSNKWVQIILSIVLVLYGVKMLFFDAKKPGGSDAKPQPKEVRAGAGHYVILLGATMALANPTLFVSWTAVLSFISSHGWLPDLFWEKVIFSFATGVGSFLWFVSLVLFVRSRRHSLSASFIKWAGTVTAILIIGFGVYFTSIIVYHWNGNS